MGGLYTDQRIVSIGQYIELAKTSDIICKQGHGLREI